MTTKALLLALLSASLFSASLRAEDSTEAARDGWDFSLSGGELKTLCDQELTLARETFAAIETDTTPATMESVFGAYDNMTMALNPIRHIWYMKSVHPDPAVVKAAEECVAQFTDFANSHELSRAYYERVSAIDPAGLDDVERHLLERQLRDFRQAGVDRDQATRDQVRRLKREITDIGTQFDKTIREDTRWIETSAAELAGLPDDYLEAHPADDKGLIRISTDYPDYFPVMKYARNDDVRKRLFRTRQNIATPANQANLEELLRKRYELATLLGYDNYAALAMDGLMIENPANAQVFLSQVSAALKQPSQRELKLLLKRLQQIDSTAKAVQAWQSGYVSNLVREEEYALDAKEVREYFSFDKVQAGIFALTQDLFDVEIVPWKTDTWHPDVSSWEIRDASGAIGRFYLDMHPRENKYKHAAHWTLRTGVKGRQLPMSGLATNFPTGLMEHGQVETFLHEFGHLLHNMFSGQQRWLGVAGMSMERDFVEAPSQMLEEWVWDYDSLRRFASNDQGKVIPKALVDKMNRARYFGQAVGTARQIFYAKLSLSLYNQDPQKFELPVLSRDITNRYSPYPYVEGTQLYNSFGHLNGYSSNYYIYQWSLAIATDLFSQFEARGLRHREVADRYRQTVLGAAGSEPARDFVADFLGRPFSINAYIQFLENLGS